nr:unnamed protein product [Callosobruchus analis]
MYYAKRVAIATYFMDFVAFPQFSDEGLLSIEREVRMITNINEYPYETLDKSNSYDDQRPSRAPALTFADREPSIFP